MASPRESRRSDHRGLTRRRTGLFAAMCALASFDALADPYGAIFMSWFLAVVGGCLACIVVELVAGRTAWYFRLAIGTGFAMLNGFLYIIFLNVMIQASIASGPSSPGAWYPVMMMLVAWILPAARLAWLLAKRGSPRA